MTSAHNKNKQTRDNKKWEEEELPVNACINESDK